jgi:hypothetical protein
MIGSEQPSQRSEGPTLACRFGTQMGTQPDPLNVVLDTFRRECDSRLSFLEREHSARKEFGLSRGDAPLATLDEYKSDGILIALFLLVQRYRLRNSVVEITYGDKDLIVLPRIFFPPLGQSFGWFELLRAAGIDDPAATGDILVQSAEKMQRVVAALSTSLQKHFLLITSPDEPMIARALDARRDERRWESETHRQAFLERARNMAADEFRKQNYRKVVELLSPFEDILSEADKSKIGLARRRAGRSKE